MAIIDLVDFNDTDFLVEVNGEKIQGSKGAATYKHTLSGPQTFKIKLLNGYKLVGGYFTYVVPFDCYYCNCYAFSFEQIDDTTILLHHPCAERPAICGFRVYGAPVTRYYPPFKEERIFEEVKPPEEKPPTLPKEELKIPPKKEEKKENILSYIILVGGIGGISYMSYRFLKKK
jgi:hypothetical protein